MTFCGNRFSAKDLILKSGGSFRAAVAGVQPASVSSQSKRQAKSSSFESNAALRMISRRSSAVFARPKSFRKRIFLTDSLISSSKAFRVSFSSLDAGTWRFGNQRFNTSDVGNSGRLAQALNRQGLDLFVSRHRQFHQRVDGKRFTAIVRNAQGDD